MYIQSVKCDDMYWYMSSICEMWWYMIICEHYMCVNVRNEPGGHVCDSWWGYEPGGNVCAACQ